MMEKWNSTYLWFAEIKYFTLYLQILPFWPGFFKLKNKNEIQNGHNLHRY